MSQVFVVYHSGYGRTELVAQHVAKGAGAQLIAIDANGDISEAQWTLLDGASGIIFGSPTYMGMASWQFKKFADATSKRWFSDAWHNKVAGGFTMSAGLSGDKLSTLQYFMTLSMQLGMVWVGQPLKGNAEGINRIGSYSGVMAQTGAMEPASSIPKGDLETAELYGKRVAGFAARLAS
jgi:NAD(P)H dehydrogenase (quinone)